MDFASLHTEKKKLSYAEAIVKLRPTMENLDELKSFRKEVSNNRKSFLKVAN